MRRPEAIAASLLVIALSTVGPSVSVARSHSSARTAAAATIKAAAPRVSLVENVDGSQFRRSDAGHTPQGRRGFGRRSRAGDSYPLFVDRRSQAARWVAAHPDDERTERIDRRIVSQATAVWLTTDNAADRAADVARRASAQHEMPILVTYFIPLRDCNQHSSGGATTPARYRSWVKRIGQAIGRAPAVVVIEPDGLALLDCLSSEQRGIRYELLRTAVSALRSAAPNAVLYLDAGHADWHAAHVMGDRLVRAGVADARGFSLNVSNFAATTASVTYGEAIAEKLEGEVGRRPGFVVDTGRNGDGPAPDGQWCNPAGRELGAVPTVRSGAGNLDMLLWIKPPGESDGSCGAAPSTAAGRFNPALANGLITGD